MGELCEVVTFLGFTLLLGVPTARSLSNVLLACGALPGVIWPATAAGGFFFGELGSFFVLELFGGAKAPAFVLCGKRDGTLSMLLMLPTSRTERLQRKCQPRAAPKRLSVALFVITKRRKHETRTARENRSVGGLALIASQPNLPYRADLALCAYTTDRSKAARCPP